MLESVSVIFKLVKVLTHSLTYLLTYSLTHSFTHSFKTIVGKNFTDLLSQEVRCR